jgi:hypothetical protein
MQKKKFLLLFKTYIVVALYYQCIKVKKKLCSADDLRNMSANLIMNIMNSVICRLKEPLPLNPIPMKFITISTEMLRGTLS